MYGSISGLIRLRGIAGSGKTVVLAMKAALAHLKDPTSHILYTFYTKSLYQHVRRLITRFYRQFDDRDPDWNYIHVLHGWGGKTIRGVYGDTCERYGVEPMSLSAAKRGPLDPFDNACTTLETTAAIQPQYDYVLIDEGQDFPGSFIRICYRLAKDGKLVFSYDELQNIFQPTAPNVDKIFGGDGTETRVEFTDDVILHRCYRNPREVLVCAHAIGFGFYSDKVVQFLEGQSHWEDVGYKFVEGDFSEGSQVVLERPEDTSLSIVASHQSKWEIVATKIAASFDEEVAWVIESIKSDLDSGLKPEDILVISVDDWNGRMYLSVIHKNLLDNSIRVNNMHEDSYSIKEFWISGHITLSTVQKAKGNEAFMVYVVGADAPMRTAGVKQRNMLFTAMTRAKAWVRISGVGEAAERLALEVKKALDNFPRLVFTQPSAKESEIIRRDIAETLDRKARVKRIVDELSEDLTDEEIAAAIAERRKELTKGKSKTHKGMDGDISK